jgi:hypothetical protein
MYSYYNVNRDLREQYLEEIKQEKVPKMPYPANINIKNYNYFLFAPTLCYDVEYPRSGPFRPWYAISKGLHALGALVIYIEVFFCS